MDYYYHTLFHIYFFLGRGVIQFGGGQLSPGTAEQSREGDYPRGKPFNLHFVPRGPSRNGSHGVDDVLTPKKTKVCCAQKIKYQSETIDGSAAAETQRMKRIKAGLQQQQAVTQTAQRRRSRKQRGARKKQVELKTVKLHFRVRRCVGSAHSAVARVQPVGRRAIAGFMLFTESWQEWDRAFCTADYQLRYGRKMLAVSKSLVFHIISWIEI